MPIQPGDKIPSTKLYENSPDITVDLAQICENKKVVIIGVPGAFTPTCSKGHLPAYIEASDELRSEGVKEIVCVAVNDPFVMEAWGRIAKVNGKVRMLADPEAHFVKAVDLTMTTPFLGGVRSQRYSMTVENGVVKEINVEPDGVGLTCSLPKRKKKAPA